MSHRWGCRVRSSPDSPLSCAGHTGLGALLCGTEEKLQKMYTGSCSFTTFCLLPGFHCHPAASFLPDLNQPLPSDA